MRVRERVKRVGVGWEVVLSRLCFFFFFLFFLVGRWVEVVVVVVVEVEVDVVRCRFLFLRFLSCLVEEEEEEFIRARTLGLNFGLVVLPRALSLAKFDI